MLRPVMSTGLDLDWTRSGLCWILLNLDWIRTVNHFINLGPDLDSSNRKKIRDQTHKQGGKEPLDKF